MSKETKKSSSKANQVDKRVDTYKSLPEQKDQQNLYENGGANVVVPDVKVSNIIGKYLISRA